MAHMAIRGINTTFPNVYLSPFHNFYPNQRAAHIQLRTGACTLICTYWVCWMPRWSYRGVAV